MVKIMNTVILDGATLGTDMDFSPFEEFGSVKVYPTTSPEEVVSHAQNADCIILNKVKLTSENLPQLPKVKLICITATGYDNVDVKYCGKNGIAVCNVAGYSTDAVAQLTLAMALSLYNKLSYFDGYVKSGDYTKSGIQNKLTPVFHEMSGKVWGIVGYGNIGERVAKVAKALGCEILAFKRKPKDGICCVELSELMKKSDIISVHLPSSEATSKIISREKIALMKQSAILINVARGAVIDEDAVTDAILNDKIGGFACDVYSAEPFTNTHPYNKILKNENVILTPHLAWGAYETRVRLLDEVAKNIKSFIDGGDRSRVDLK